MALVVTPLVEALFGDVVVVGLWEVVPPKLMLSVVVEEPSTGEQVAHLQGGPAGASSRPLEVAPSKDGLATLH